MIEFGITSYSSIKMFKVSYAVFGTTRVFILILFQTIKSTMGAKPCLTFAGDAFETEAEYMRLKSLLIGMCAMCVNIVCVCNTCC